MSLLTIIENVTEDLGIATPTTVINNTDRQIVQLLAIANREGRDLASRFGWSRLITEKTYTIISGRDQGAFNSTICTGGDFDYLVNQTMWNRTTDLPIVGPVSESDRQAFKAFSVTGPYQRYWVQGGHLYLDPAPSGGDTLAFEYKSKFWCESSATSAGQSKWNDDSDLGRLDEDLMTLGIIWRWRQRKGLDYAEDMRTYETRVADAIVRDKSGRTLNLNGGDDNRTPGTLVPSGNWIL